MRDRPTGTRIAVVAMMLIGALAITACGDDDGDEAPRPRTLAVEVTERGEKRFGLSAPRSVEAGLVEISLSSPAGKTTHDAQLLRVDGEHTAEEVVKAISAAGEAPIPRWLSPAGGVGQTKAGVRSSATQQLAPGKYYILDTGQPEGDNVKSYFETGAIAALEVTGKLGAQELPETDAKITAKDYTFTARGLKAGSNQIRFENAGKEPHHVIAFPYRKGATLADVRKAFMQEGPPAGPSPVDSENIVGAATLAGGTKQVTELRLRSGKYALVCFLSDRKGGPPHMAKGMIAEASVE